MPENIASQQINPEKLEFSKDIAHIEIDPNAKRHKKIPIIKIIIYFVIFIIMISVLAYVLFLAKDQDKFQKLSKNVTSEVESKLKAYPKPLPNSCGEEILLCPNGKVVEKSGLKCEFEACLEGTIDMTKFWKASNSDKKHVRTYENLDLKYKFNLVKNWNFTGLDYGFIIYSPNYDCDNITPGKACDGTIIEMISSNTTAETDVEDWYISQENYFRVNSDVLWPDNYKIKQISNTKAVQIENALNNLSFFFIYDNSVFALKLVSASTSDFKNSLPVFNEIISSFEILN